MTPIDTIRAFARRRGLNVAEVVELFVERAAIREYDGGLSREEAERGAVVDCVERWGER